MTKTDVFEIFNSVLLILNGFCAIWFSCVDGRYDMATFHLVFMLIFTVIIMLSRVSADVNEMIKKIEETDEEEEVNDSDDSGLHEV